MTLLAGLLLAGALFEGAPRPTHFDVTATFNPARRNAPGEVAVQFVAKDPDVKINEVPAPRLKLEAGPRRGRPARPPGGGRGQGRRRRRRARALPGPDPARDVPGDAWPRARPAARTTRRAP